MEPPAPIGEIEQTVFACPACSRPLALGARRCPGCGSRLLMRVEARRASVLVGLGLIVGLAAGGVLTAASFLAGQPAREAAIASAAAAAALASASQLPASAGPTATPAGSGSRPASSSGSGSASGVSALTRSAIGQAAAIDARLVTSQVALATAVAAPSFDAIAVSQILRTMSADAVYGLQLTSHIEAWDGGRDLSTELAAFYSAIKDTAAEGLTASIRNEAAYQAASTAMLELLESLSDVDASVLAAARRAGVELP